MLEMISIPLLNRILLFFYSLCRVTIRTQFQTYFWVSRKFLIQLWGQKGGEGWPPPLSPGLYQQMQFIAYKVTIIRAANITTELLFLLVMPFPRDSPGKIILHMDH